MIQGLAEFFQSQFLLCQSGYSVLIVLILFNICQLEFCFFVNFCALKLQIILNTGTVSLLGLLSLEALWLEHAWYFVTVDPDPIRFDISDVGSCSCRLQILMI